jgi:putative ABC transport system substrate-binding protein
MLADGAGVIRPFEEAAGAMGLQTLLLPLVDRAAMDDVGRLARQGRAQAIVTVETTFVRANRTRIADVVAAQGIPVMGKFTLFGTEGVLMAYGVDLTDGLRRAASYIDSILKGSRPGDLPIERPSKLDLTVNRKVARGLGIAIPQSILLRADRVIE